MYKTMREGPGNRCSREDSPEGAGSPDICLVFGVYNVGSVYDTVCGIIREG